MKSIAALTGALAFFLAASAEGQEAWKPYNLGIKWEPSLEAAQKRAARAGKPVLLHQLVGDLDREGC